MPFSFLNLDSLNANYNTSSINSTFSVDISNCLTCANAFNAEYDLRVPLRNVKRIYLKSVELPIGFPNIRSSNLSNTLTVATGESSGTTYSITLNDKVYQSIDTLISDINSAFSTAYPSVNIVFSTNTSSTNYGFVKLTTTSTGIFTSGIYVRSGILANDILGFNSSSDITTSTSRIASGIYQLSLDTYVNMWISNLQNSNTFNNSGVPCSFKIALPAASNTILFSGSNLNYDSFITVDPSTPISKLNVILYDRYGKSINSRNLDWSFTLMVES